jgi:hypothetical protein
MYLSELDNQYARERYADYANAARIGRLIREAQAAAQPAQPTRKESLLTRILAALRTQRAVRA